MNQKRKRVPARKIQDTNVLFSQVIDSVSAHIAVLDHKGVIVATNKAWKNFGKENTPVHKKLAHTDVGANYLNVLRSSKGEKAEESVPSLKGIQGVLKGKLKSYALEYRCDSLTERRWFRMVVLPLGAKKGVVITHHDITDSQLIQEQQQNYATELEQRVNERTKELKLALSKEHELIHLKDKFMTTTSHEFRTPLAIISTAIGLIRKRQHEVDKKNLNDKLDQIQKQIDRMVFLLEDLFFMGNNDQAG